jgi:hypothetical protein
LRRFADFSSVASSAPTSAVILPWREMIDRLVLCLLHSTLC